MRRWFAILLLVLLSLQSLWVAAAPYCAHEENPVSMHIGHHTHQHQGDQLDDDSAGGLGTLHSDCNVCHGAGGVVPAQVIASASVGPSDLAAPWPRALPTPPIPQLDRPNWARRA
jgi:hypothetical protein